MLLASFLQNNGFSLKLVAFDSFMVKLKSPTRIGKGL